MIVFSKSSNFFAFYWCGVEGVHHVAWGMIQSKPSASEVWNLNHWSIREVHRKFFVSESDGNSASLETVYSTKLHSILLSSYE